MRKVRLVAIAHLIHGYLGAGKTTLAKEIEASKGALRLSSDEWYLRLFTSGEPTSILDPSLQDRLSQVLYELWPKVLARGIDVVLDFGFWTRGERDTARKLAADVGGVAQLYSVQCPEEVALQRVLQRNGSADHFYLDEGAFDFLKGKFEGLGEDEDFILVTT